MEDKEVLVGPSVDVNAPVVNKNVGVKPEAFLGMPDISGVVSLITLITSHMDEIKLAISKVQELIALLTKVSSAIQKNKLEPPIEAKDDA